jgi:ParB/RepB/Spo0J family partition protein
MLRRARNEAREVNMASQTKPTNSLKPDPKQPRKFFSEEELDRLGDDMLARGVLVDLLIKPDGTIIDGERRWRAAQRKGIKELPVKVIDKPLTDKDLRGNQLATVLHRADLSGYEKWMACAELMMMNPQCQLKNLAEFLHLDPSMVTRLLSPSKCIPTVQDALKEGALGISDCYEFSQESPDRQAELLRMKLAGASRAAIKVARSKSRNGNTSAARLSRVKIAMPRSMSVVISGNELSMSDVVELLTETLKEARKAAEQYDVRTFQSMMRDKAKAGGKHE